MEKPEITIFSFFAILFSAELTSLWSSSSRFFLELLLWLSLLGWTTILGISWSYLHKYPPFIARWIQPLIWTLYLFCATNVAATFWVIILSYRSPNPILPGRIFFIFISQFSLYAMATMLWIYYRRVPGYLYRLAQHKLNSDRFKALAESICDGIIEIDTASYIGFANPTAVKMFGYNVEGDLFGEKITMLMPESFRSLHLKGMELYLSTGKSVLIGKKAVELIGLRKDGSEFPIEITISEYKVGDNSRFTAVIHDISKRRELEIANHDTT